MKETKRKSSTPPTNRTPKKRAVGTTVTSATAKMTTTKVATPKTRLRKSNVTAPSKKFEGEAVIASVDLPTNMSLRSIEKTTVLKREFDHFYRNAMYQIAYVSGLCFLLVGIAYISFGQVNTPQGQSAETIDSVITASDSPVAIPLSEFKFLSSIPSNIIEPTPVSFEVTYADDVVVNVTPKDQFNGYSTVLKKVSENRYSLIIPGPDKIQPGYYNLRVLVRATNGDKYTRKSTEFFVGNADIEAWYNQPTDTSTPEEKTADTSSGDDSSTTDTSPETKNTTETNTSDTSSPSEPEIVHEEEKTDTPPVTEEQPLTLQLSSPLGTSVTGLAKLTLKATYPLQFVELYARGTTATTPTFIALGTYRLDRWIFQFDSANLPNGEYSFFAKTRINTTSVVSPSITLKVVNENLVTAPTTPNVIPDEERVLITTDDLPTDDTSATLADVATETEALLVENKEGINTLLERYAAARAAGDDSLVVAAKEAINEERERIAIRTATDSRTRDISDSVDSTLAQKLDDLQNRIDTFETLRKERSGGATAIDTDSDGISDVDEITLYKTDPNIADTDGDGFSDGVEIVRGYNPTDATPEAVVTFESPKESVGLTRDDVLTVDVVPVPVVNTNSVETTFSTEIRGRALPNSYVTLYIYSSPTVVTVRTDADGTFIYTFDKELEDGRHDVYVAITDNAGEIIAQSNPFSFIKEAQAFTPVAATEADTITAVTAVTDIEQRGYSTTVGISILTFGLVLFMLGISLRRKDDEIIITENTLESDATSKL
jgi:hypothetical protein